MRSRLPRSLILAAVLALGSGAQKHGGLRRSRSSIQRAPYPSSTSATDATGSPQERELPARNGIGYRDGPRCRSSLPVWHEGIDAVVSVALASLCGCSEGQTSGAAISGLAAAAILLPVRPVMEFHRKNTAAGRTMPDRFGSSVLRRLILCNAKVWGPASTVFVAPSSA